MTIDAAKAVGDAVLYEGYVLYPYRASARKNHARWQFGVLMPPAYAEADGSESSRLQAECLLEAGGDITLDVCVRFLQLQSRTLEAAGPSGTSFHAVDTLRIGDEEVLP
ncbi:MAG TPA: hypothetical protein VIE40_04915, partial [Dehalococcoidia bacterium]